MKKYLLYFMIVFYFCAGLLHLIFYKKFLFFMPAWVPMQIPLILFSGIVEMTLAVLLFFKSTRKLAAWMIIAMLILYLFVNHLTQSIEFYADQNSLFTFTIIRLMIQIVLIWWAWIFTRDKKLKA